MTEPTFYRFGPYELDGARRELRRHGQRVRIQRKPLGVLEYLIRNADRVVSREELLRAVWTDASVEEGALKSAIYALRRALIDPGSDADAEDEGWIRSFHGLGYRFMASPRVTSPGAREDSPRSAASPGLGDFVDREHEMEQLSALCAAALHGERQIVLLDGPPGIGKTRTAAEIARAARSLGFECHEGRTHEGDGAPPFWPWTQILRSWIAAHGAPSFDALAGADRTALLSALEPEWTKPVEDARLESAASDQARFRILDCALRFFARTAEQRPLLLVLDDLHRADSASLDLLLFVAQHLTRARLMIVATHRPLAPGHALGRALREPAVRSIALAGLVRESVESILIRALDGEPTAALVERVFAASGGNPLFVSELARALASDARSAQDAHAAPLPIPARLHDAVWARICECSHEARQALRLASVAGPELTLPLLLRALRSELDDASVRRSLDEAQQRHLIAPAPDVVRFVHGIVREALYERLSHTERIQLHRQIGEAIEELHGKDGGGRLAELAHHFLESAALAAPERAIAYARRAAAAARAVYAYREAAELCRRALDVVPFLESSEPELRVGLRVELGDVLGHGAAPVGSFQAVFFEAIDQARLARLPLWVARAAERCAMHLASIGGFGGTRSDDEEQMRERLRAALEQATRAPELKQDPELDARTALALSRVLYAGEDFVSCRRALGYARTQVDRLSIPKLCVDAYALGYEVDFEHQPGTVPAELHTWAGQAEDFGTSLVVAAIELDAALGRGDRAGCEQAAASMKQIAEQSGIPMARYRLALWESLKAQLEGPMQRFQAEVGATTQVALSLNMSRSWTVRGVAACQAWVFGMLEGSVDGLLATIEGQLAQTNLHVRIIDMGIRVTLARLRAQRGRLDEVRRTLPAVVRDLGQIEHSLPWLVSVGTAAELCGFVDDPESTAALHTLLAPYASRVLTLQDNLMCLGSAARPLGTLCARLGRWEEADGYFAQALEHARSLDAPVLQALADTDRVLAFRAHPDAAERLRNEKRHRSVVARARRLGLGGLLERLEA